MEKKLSNNELIEGIYHNIYSDCQDNNDYDVRDILDYLGKNTEDIIDFLEENITATGEGFFDMFYEENHFTDEQMQTIKDYNGVDAFLYCQRLGLFCDIRTSFNAGEYNYMRIFKGEDWQDVARDIAEDFEDKQMRGKFELKCEYKAFRFKCDALKYAEELAKEYRATIVNTDRKLNVKDACPGDMPYPCIGDMECVEVQTKNYDYTTLAVVGWWDDVPEENKNEYINVYDANVNDCDYQVLRNGVVMAKYLTEDGAKALRDEYIKSSVRGMFIVDDEFTIEQVDLVEILNKLSGYNKYK